MGRKIAALTLAAAATLAVIGLSPDRATAADADPKGVAFFEAKIRPILATSCVGCHGADKQKGKLRLDTREGLIKGGEEDGKAIVVWDEKTPEKGEIIDVIEYKDDDHQMPPMKKGKSMKLADAQIADFKAWLKMGAPYGTAPVVAAKDAAK